MTRALLTVACLDAAYRWGPGSIPITRTAIRRKLGIEAHPTRRNHA